MSRSVVVIAPPASLPVALEELKTQLRLEGDDGSQDHLLTNCLGSAVALFERETQTALVSRSLRLCLDAFPADGAPVHLAVPPTLAVTAVKHLDPDRVEQTLDPADYTADVNHHPGRVAPLDGAWPAAASMLGAVSIDFDAGFASAAAVPADAKNAVRMLAAHYYENAEATTTLQLRDVPLAVRTVLDLYRMPRL